MPSFGISCFSRVDGYVDCALSTTPGLFPGEVHYQRRDQGRNPLTPWGHRPYRGDLGFTPLTGRVATSGPAVVHPRDQPASIFVRGTNGELLWSPHDGNPGYDAENWTFPWITIGNGTPITSAPSAVSHWADGIQVFARLTDTRLYYLQYDSSRWTNSWRDIATGFPNASDPNGGPFLSSDPIAVSSAPGDVHVFAVAQDNTLRGWHWWQNRWEMHNYGNGGLTLTGRPAVSSWDSDRLDVFVHTVEGPTLWRVHDSASSSAVRFDEWLLGWDPWQRLPWAATFIGPDLVWDAAAVSWAPNALNVITLIWTAAAPPFGVITFERRYDARRAWFDPDDGPDSIVGNPP